jgi:predicted HTH transcriptional regulator
MTTLVLKAGDQLIRRRFTTIAALISAVYTSLVQYLVDKELIRTGPFDGTFCRNATLDDLDGDRIVSFVGLARRARGFPLPDDSRPLDVLTHMNLLDSGRPTNAAVLLFGKQPQRFLISSELKCAHFHGTVVAKPIPSYQVYKGTVFELVDQAVDFVMSKIDRWVGTRAESAQAPTIYEIPREVVAEAIVNAVAHRDYTCNGSVQVMLFSDRLEIWNPGTLPPSLTLEKLRHPHGSVPHNPLLAEPLYLMKYIERMGTGTGDMITRCREVGLAEPEFALTDGFVTIIRRRTLPVLQEAVTLAGTKLALSRHQVDVLRKCRIESSLVDLMELIGRLDRTKFRNQVLKPMMEAELIEMTFPDKPRSSRQKYRITGKGRVFLKEEGD